MDHDIDWVALIGGFVLAWVLVMVLPQILAVPLTLAAVLTWHRHWKRRNALIE